MTSSHLAPAPCQWFDRLAARAMSTRVERGGVSCWASKFVRSYRSLVGVFAVREGLGESFNHSSYSEGLLIEGASYGAGADLIRVWYASDGKNVMLVTYVCDWADSHRETAEVERSVQSIRFAAGESD